jgi:hypothetical protein
VSKWAVSLQHQINEIMTTALKFESVKTGQTVTFFNNNNIESGIVSSVGKRTFQLRALRCFDKNGVKCFYDAFFNFYKSGKKAHQNNTYGNAIEIITN